uniref:Putative ovule protein n=1 Tax=Solanum chacoense TaxID=4108 RepID=A0A0V0GIP6_SOLCH
MFLSIFGLSWVMPQSFKEAYECWSCWEIGKAIRSTWRMIPARICWCLWLERNSRYSDGLSTFNP